MHDGFATSLAWELGYEPDGTTHYVIPLRCVLVVVVGSDRSLLERNEGDRIDVLAFNEINDFASCVSERGRRFYDLHTDPRTGLSDGARRRNRNYEFAATATKLIEIAHDLVGKIPSKQQSIVGLLRQ